MDRKWERGNRGSGEKGSMGDEDSNSIATTTECQQVTTELCRPSQAFGGKPVPGEALELGGTERL